MSRLEAEFGDEVDFIHIDWDDPDSRDIIEVFGVPRRSSYFILNPQGDVLWTFVGAIEEEVVARELENALDR